MPTIRIKGWQPDSVPSVLPASLTRLFEEEAAMDVEQVERALKRLKTGRDVDVPFDLGDEAAAQGMMKKLAALGLESELCVDIRRIGGGPRLPTWFMKYIVAGSLGLSSLWILITRLFPGPLASKVLVPLTVLFVVSIPTIYGVHRDSLWTEEAQAEEERRDTRFRLWVYGGLALIGVFIADPRLGLLLLAIGVGGIGCAAIIRLINQRGERRLEALRKFDPNDKAG